MSEKNIEKQVEVNFLLFKEIKKKAKELTALREISKEIGASLNLDKLLFIIMDRTIDLLDGKNGSILLIDSSSNELNVAVSRGLSEEEIKELKTKMKEDISRSHVTRAFMHTPLKIKNDIIGVISITNGQRKGFTKHHLDILKQLADQAAVAIDNARVHQKLKDTALDIIKALAVSLDQRDHYTSRHSQNVAYYAVAIARAMDLPKNDIERIKQAAELHDIGKIGISDYILSKPGKLTPEEWEEIKKHTIKGEEILKPLEFLNGISDLVRQHHERPDGKGYPNGLKEKEILLGARIMAVADSFDAMTSDRPYRPGMNRQKAIDSIKRLSGVMYDPEVVKAFLRAVDKKFI